MAELNGLDGKFIVRGKLTERLHGPWQEIFQRQSRRRWMWTDLQAGIERTGRMVSTWFSKPSATLIEYRFRIEMRHSLSDNQTIYPSRCHPPRLPSQKNKIPNPKTMKCMNCIVYANRRFIIMHRTLRIANYNEKYWQWNITARKKNVWARPRFVLRQ